MEADRRSVIQAAFLAAGACLLASLWSAVATAQAPQARRGGLTIDPRAQERTYHFADAKQDMPYCMFASSKVSRDKPAPLIVSLHGLGAGPQIMCNKTAVDLAEEGGYILVAPMGYNTGGWYGSPVMVRRGGANPAAAAAEAPAGPGPEQVARWSEQDVMNVLDMMRKEFSVDAKRIYLTGHSMGGAGTYFLGSKHAGIWAAIAPVAPASFLMNQNRAEILKGIKDAGLPILVITGDADEAVPVANTRMWVETIKELGLDYEYIEQPGVTHGPIITSSQKDVYTFFGKHSRK